MIKVQEKTGNWKRKSLGRRMGGSTSKVFNFFFFFYLLGFLPRFLFIAFSLTFGSLLSGDYVI